MFEMRLRVRNNLEIYVRPSVAEDLSLLRYTELCGSGNHFRVHAGNESELHGDVIDLYRVVRGFCDERR